MIKSFTGEYSFLSNFALVDINHLNKCFSSVENAYAASKCKYPEDIDKFVGITSGNAKRMGRRIAIRDDWEDIKLQVMEELLIQKFSKQPFKQKLIDTKDQQIFEGNTWGDTFWGVDINSLSGQNNLGKLLMKIRSQIQQ